MGLLQKAIETYDAMEGLAGIYEVGKEPLAPIGHIVTKAQIELTIDAEGRFVEAKAAEKDLKIIIPATEKSAGRSNNPPPHPLCDQLAYLLGTNGKKKEYIAQLEKWVQSEYTHPKVAAVFRYMEKGTIFDDLTAAGLLTFVDGKLKNDRDVVCWRVGGLGTDSPVWKDISLMKVYADYYLSQKQNGVGLCMVTGSSGVIAEQHLKGILPQKGNAKIISSNDDKNYTYRGRFEKASEAISVGYIASQKAHNALKWLVSTQGQVEGQRAFVCWNPQGKQLPKLTSPLVFPSEDTPAIPKYRSYQEALRKRLEGYQNELKASEQVVIASFDATTDNTGRLAITYYNELLGSDFLERLEYWDKTFCWIDNLWGIFSPTLYNIVKFAFGIPRKGGSTLELDKQIVAPQVQRLLTCRVDKAAFPLDIMRVLVTRAEHLHNYSEQAPKVKTKGSKKQTEDIRRKLLFTTCAAIRKYHIDHYKEVLTMALEPERKDRSYQWGRLLAVMEKLERDTYKEASVSREPNAIRMQSVFARRPGYASKIIMDQLKSVYYPQLPVGARIYYDRLIGEIMEQLSRFSPDEYGKPLTEMYLPGYYLQKNALYTKKEAVETEDENDEV